MSALGIVALAAALSAAPPAPAQKSRLLVAVSRHGGVSLPRAVAIAGEVQAALTGVPAEQAVADFSSCKTKRLCLLTEARKAGATVVVTVEVSSVLDDGTLRVEALSLDDDGARIGLAQSSGPVDKLVAAARTELAGKFSTALRATLGLVPPPAPPPAPLVEAPPPPPPPTPSQPEPAQVVAVAPDAPGLVAPAPPPEPPFFSTSRVVGVTVAGAGAAALIASGIFGLQALNAAAQSHSLCPAGTPCADPVAFGDYTRAAHAQNLGVALAAGGGAALVGGVLLMLLNPGAASNGPSATVTLVPGGVSAQVHGTF